MQTLISIQFILSKNYPEVALSGKVTKYPSHIHISVDNVYHGNLSKTGGVFKKTYKKKLNCIIHGKLHHNLT